MHPALERFLERFRPVSEALLDSWFVVDAERNLVEYNRAFYALLPRAVARNLKGRKCHEVLELEICGDRCIAEQCWRDGQKVRLDGIGGRPAQSEEPMRFVLSAIPILDDDGQIVGALEIQRNVTDEAQVQSKYKEILDQEAQERRRLEDQIRSRTRELLEANKALITAQRDLLACKGGLEG